MTELNYKFTNASKAIKSFDKAYKFYQEEIPKLNLIQKDDLTLITRDSVIQRFEYSTELLWKLLYAFLQDRHGNGFSASPKNTFRDAFKAKILSEQDAQLAIKMIDDRNNTAHNYKEEIAQQLLKQIPTYLKLMKKILKEIKQEL
jgi:nucleotidyltransferase substrate binding protein (TIGR01987 family)